MAKTSSDPHPPSIQRTDPVAPRSDTPGDAPDQQVDTASQKRSRGRPPKSKSGVSSQPTRKPSGRPKRSGAPAIPTASVAAAVKSRSRAKRSNPLPATAAQVTTNAAVASRKRGRPKSEGVVAKSLGRPKKVASVATQAAGTKELKKTAALLQKKVKEAADKLKRAVTAIEEVQVIVDGM